VGLQSVLDSFPKARDEFIKWIVFPRKFTKEKLSKTDQNISTYETISWCSASILLILGLSSAFIGNPMEYLLYKAGSMEEKSKIYKDAKLFQKSKQIKIVNIYTNFTFSKFYGGLSFLFPEFKTKGALTPQLFKIRFGSCEFLLGNVVPDQILKGSIPFLCIFNVSVTFAICISISGLLIQSKVNIVDSLKISICYFSYLGLFIVAWGTVAFTILLFFNSLKSVFCIFIVNGIWVIVAFRSFVLSFSELYNVSKIKIILLLLISNYMTLLCAPLIFLPLMFLSLHFQPYLDALL